MGIFVDVNFGINVRGYGINTISFPKERQMLQIKLMMWLGWGEWLRWSNYFLCHQNLIAKSKQTLTEGIFFMIVHYIVYLRFNALFCLCVVFGNKKVKQFNVLPAKRRLMVFSVLKVRDCLWALRCIAGVTRHLPCALDFIYSLGF